jgi:predicted  nucleic acid-binding Zn-ribbon protein
LPAVAGTPSPTQEQALTDLAARIQQLESDAVKLREQAAQALEAAQAARAELEQLKAAAAGRRCRGNSPEGRARRRRQRQPSTRPSA